MTALSGNYVNFGVFELYGDRALSDALDAALKMMLSISLSDILAYRKVFIQNISLPYIVIMLCIIRCYFDCSSNLHWSLLCDGQIFNFMCFFKLCSSLMLLCPRKLKLNVHKICLMLKIYFIE